MGRIDLSRRRRKLKTRSERNRGRDRRPRSPLPISVTSNSQSEHESTTREVRTSIPTAVSTARAEHGSGSSSPPSTVRAERGSTSRTIPRTGSSSSTSSGTGNTRPIRNWKSNNNISPRRNRESSSSMPESSGSDPASSRHSQSCSSSSERGSDSESSRPESSSSDEEGEGEKLFHYEGVNLGEETYDSDEAETIKMLAVLQSMINVGLDIHKTDFGALAAQAEYMVYALSEENKKNTPKEWVPNSAPTPRIRQLTPRESTPRQPTTPTEPTSGESSSREPTPYPPAEVNPPQPTASQGFDLGSIWSAITAQFEVTERPKVTTPPPVVKDIPATKAPPQEKKDHTVTFELMERPNSAPAGPSSDPKSIPARKHKKHHHHQRPMSADAASPVAADFKRKLERGVPKGIRSEPQPAGIGRLSSASTVRFIRDPPPRPTKLDSSSTASGVQYTTKGRYKIKHTPTSELYRKFLEKERRRQAGVIVTSSTSSTVDSKDLEAQLRRKRNQRPMGCCWCLSTCWRKFTYSWCICAQNYLYRVPCMKYRKTPWTEDEVHDMQMMWAYCGRTSNSAGYVAALYRHASLANIPKGRIESFKQRTVALRNTHLTLRHLDRAVTLCRQIVDRLSFSDLYFPFKPDPTVRAALNGRCILGTYAWLTTFALRFFDIPKTELAGTYDPYQKKWEEIFASSTAMYSGICHMYFSIKNVLKKFESLIAKWTFNIKPYTTTGERPPIEIIKFKDEIKIREKWRKEKHRMDHQIRWYKCHWDTRKPMPDPPLLNVIMKYEGTHKHWYDFDNLHWREQVKTLILFYKHVKTTCDDSFGMLRALDREMFVRRKKRKRRKNDPRCVYRGVRILRKVYRSFSYFPFNMIKPSEVLEFNECGRIMLDKIDKFYAQLYAMKDLAREGQLMIQLCYEYVRTVYGWPLPSYTRRFNILHQKFMVRWAHHELFTAREWALKMNSPEALFNTSPYQVLVRYCPIRIGRLLLSVETPSEATANRQPRDDDPELPKSDDVHTLDDAIKVPLRGNPELSKRIKDKTKKRKKFTFKLY